MTGNKIIKKVIVFADNYDQFKLFKESEEFFDTDKLVYFNQPETMLISMLDCIILDIRKTNINQKYLDYVNNFPVWKKVN